MGQKTTIPEQEERNPRTEGEEGDESVEFDWVGIPATVCASRMDSVGKNDGAEAGDLEHEEVRGTKTIEGRRSGRMYGDRDGEECV